MGQYHYLVNLDKKQFVHPHQIANGMKIAEQIGWDYSTATVLVMLLASSSKNGGRGGGDFRAKHSLIGAWAGDRVAFIGDYAEPSDIPGYDAALIRQQVAAASNSGKTESQGKDVNQWTNISAEVREMMMAEFGIRYVGDGWQKIEEAAPDSN
jgi:hypothetical protein